MHIIDNAHKVIVQLDDGRYRECFAISRTSLSWERKDNFFVFSVGDSQVVHQMVIVDKDVDNSFYAIIDPSKPFEKQIIALASRVAFSLDQPGPIVAIVKQ